MKFTYDSIPLFKEGCQFNQNSPKDLLQYAISGLLYMPAHRTQIVDEIIAGLHPCCSSICLDLEDSIGDGTVHQAELQLFETLDKLNQALETGQLDFDSLPLIFIRVRSSQQFNQMLEHSSPDIFKLVSGFNFPKFDSTTAPAYLQVFDNFSKRTNQTFYIMPILESESIMKKNTRMEELLFISELLKPYKEKALNIRVGATDFSNIFGIRRNVHQTIYDVKLIADCLTDILNIFSADYICSGPVWEYFNSRFQDGNWAHGLKKELELDRLNGFIGKTCIHPSQLSLIAENNIVSLEDYQDALTILNTNQQQIGVIKGYKENRMNEMKPHSKWAKKIIQLATVYGVAEGDNTKDNSLKS